MRIAVINKKDCIAPSECPYICRNVCPIVRTGKECIVEGTDKKPIIDEGLCIGCGICVKKCPTKCINIINLPKELASEAIHRYSKNGFKLFRTIVPHFGQVTGILGPNGIGKTSAISILAGMIKPNLGRVGEEIHEKEIISFFKGSEAQGYFEKLYRGEINLAYKPQYVDKIPKEFSGSVRELLKKVDHQGKMEEICTKLGITHIIDRDLKNISGGELQRTAIAATLLKNANVLFIDEPSSYLDIKQRLAIAKLFYDMSAPDKSINIIEHDLIVLDYMADLIQIVYGQTGVYGVVSKVMAAKNGINTYLEGFLKDENMRFRETSILFDVKPPNPSAFENIIIGWSDIRKKLGEFEIHVKSGEIGLGEVIGIVGENGTGKTTFAKMLAGEIKSDSGEVNKKVKLSYKPQYIDSESDSTVGDALASVTKEYGTDEYRHAIIRPLEIEKLINHKINSLSGGELQRVSIAICLSREAEVYLLDEPSAYLDVEQRLRVAKMIRERIKKIRASAIVIDHDLLFIDYVSERLMVFGGVPSKKGNAIGPLSMKEGMDTFLKSVNLTLRRDEQTSRPRINKPGSVKDREQKEKGDYYYQGK